MRQLKIIGMMLLLLGGAVAVYFLVWGLLHLFAWFWGSREDAVATLILLTSLTVLYFIIGMYVDDWPLIKDVFGLKRDGPDESTFNN